MPTDLIPDIVQAIQNGQSWLAYTLLAGSGVGVFIILPKAWHPRNRKSVLNAFAWLFLILVLYFETNISAFVFFLICCIALLFVGLGFWLAYKPLFWESAVFNRYEDWLLKMMYIQLMVSYSVNHGIFVLLQHKSNGKKLQSGFYIRKRNFTDRLKPAVTPKIIFPCWNRKCLGLFPIRCFAFGIWVIQREPRMNYMIKRD